MKLENHLPNIWIPSANSFYEVEKVPILGTGKLDLAAVKKWPPRLTSRSRRITCCEFSQS